MDELDRILSDVAIEEERLEIEEEQKDWYCDDCEHGPMVEKDTHCSRCGIRGVKEYEDESMDGWEEEDIESEVDEIY
jgi:Zn finger protein HypA/HybF involved in hydrogenase expression